MQEKLVIYLHANELDRPSWAVIDTDKSVRQSARHDNAEGLAQIAHEKSVTVIVPAEDVFIAVTKLPKMSRARMKQTLPYALEEQIINDVETLHFAAGAQAELGDVPVAIVAKDKMQQWKALLKAWGIAPDVMISSVYALPCEDNQWSVMIDEMANVRVDDWSGFAGDRSNLPELINLAILASQNPPQRIHISNYTNHAFKTALPMVASITEDFKNPEMLIQDAALQVVKTPHINLLQGPYAVKKTKLPQTNKVWKVISNLSKAFVVLLLLYPIVSHVLLGSKVGSIDRQINAIYRQNFPQANSIVAPKQRMEEKLQKLNARIGENKLLMLLGYVGKGMAQTASIKIKRMDFQSNQLTLELSAGSSEDFSTFTDFLNSQGLSVKQQNANLTGTHVNATLQID